MPDVGEMVKQSLVLTVIITVTYRINVYLIFKNDMEIHATYTSIRFSGIKGSVFLPSGVELGMKKG